jgi:phage recombination protein Bet
MGMTDDRAALAVREQRMEIGAYEQFTDKERALIHRTVAPGTTPEELTMFLSICGGHNLNPLVHEAWCIKMPGKNGEEGKLTIIVGKYGWLKIVNRYPDYLGTVSQVVHAGDTFKYSSTPKKTEQGVYSHVTHEFDVTAEDRGKLLGAYSEVYREGKPTEFFYAKIEQYQPFATTRRYDDQDEFDFHGVAVFLSKRDYYSPWLAQADSMILKCSQTTAWRNAFPIGAMYGEEEMSSAMAPKLAGDGEPKSVGDEIEWGDTEDSADRVRSVFAAANAAKPGTYTDAKIRLLLGGLSDEERYALLAEEIIPFIEANGGTVPDPDEIVVADDDVEVQHPDADDADDDREPVPQEETLPGV